MKDHQDTPGNAERRRFLSVSKKFGFTAALVAGASGSLLLSEEAAAATADRVNREATRRVVERVLLREGCVAQYRG